MILIVDANLQFNLEANWIQSIQLRKSLSSKDNFEGKSIINYYSKVELSINFKKIYTLFYKNTVYKNHEAQISEILRIF